MTVPLSRCVSVQRGLFRLIWRVRWIENLLDFTRFHLGFHADLISENRVKNGGGLVCTVSLTSKSDFEITLDSCVIKNSP